MCSMDDVHREALYELHGMNFIVGNHEERHEIRAMKFGQ